MSSLRDHRKNAGELRVVEIEFGAELLAEHIEKWAGARQARQQEEVIYLSDAIRMLERDIRETTKLLDKRS